MPGYLIEFRFHGSAKYKIKEIIYDINGLFSLGYKKAIPHITLAGPFTTSDEQRLIRDFKRLCAGSPLMAFEVHGFSTFEENGVIFLEVKPGKALKKFRLDLSGILRPYCKLSQFDYKSDFAFHSTIALKLQQDKFHAIQDFLKGKSGIRFKHFMVRATLLKGGIILNEYDFLHRKLLTRSQARDKEIYSQTLDLLTNITRR